jgi:glucosylceramidase
MVSARSQCAFASLLALGLAASCGSSKPSGTAGTGSSTGTQSSGSMAVTGASGVGSSGAGSGSATSGAGTGSVGSGATAGTSTSGAGGIGSGMASTGAGGSGAAGAGMGSGMASGSSGTGGSSGASVIGMYKTVTGVQSSRSAGAGMMPEHVAPITTPLTIAAAGTGTGTIITVNAAMPRQTITGFGAALTEVVASTIAILTPAQQTEIYTKLFSPTENSYTLTRAHIGSCDFALSAYTFDENGGVADPTLANFSIKQDMDYLIPGLKAASTASNGTLKILGSPWTAPTWMKTVKAFNDGSLQPMYYTTYAQYLSKYVQAYTAQGLNIWAITPQNEPLITGPGPREIMYFPLDTMNTFIKTALGPQFATDKLTTKIFSYDHNKGPLPNTDEVLFAKTMFVDPVTGPFLQGTALHWYGSTFEVYEATLDFLHTTYPTKDILYDEGVADGFIFGGAANGGAQPVASTTAHITAAWMNDDWFWDANEYDWGWDYANGAAGGHPGPYSVVTRYARDIIVGLNHWYTGWIDWTAVLNKWGAQDAAGGGMGSPGPLGSNAYSSTRADPGVSHIENGNPASIMVDEMPAGGTNQTGTIYYTPVYYVMRHISKYIQPGATILQTTLSTMPGGDNTTTAAQTFFATAGHNADGTTAVVIFNSGTAAVPYTVTISGQSVTGSIPAQAIQTLVLQ